MLTTKNEIKLDAAFFGQKTAIVAKSGYGKSYAARVFVEEGLSSGHTFTIIDPQGAYKNLPNFDYIEATDVKNVTVLGRILAQTHKNVVIQTKQLTESKQQLFVQKLLESMKTNIQKGIQTVIIDEMHKFAPETSNPPSKEIVRSLHQENRSDGLGIIGITQRPARMDKTCLSQVDNLAMGRVNSSADKKALENYLDEKEDVKNLTKLDKGEMLFLGFGMDEITQAKIRKASTKHSGDSPQNLLNEDVKLYSSTIAKAVVKRKNTMSESSNATSLLPKDVNTVKDFAAKGMKMSLGLATSFVVSNVVGRMLPSPIPYVSSRTIGSAGTFVVLYAGHKFAKKKNMDLAADILGDASAGSAAYLVGSVAADVLTAMNVSLPPVVQSVFSAATGVAPATVEKASEADLNTVFA